MNSYILLRGSILLQYARRSGTQQRLLRCRSRITFSASRSFSQTPLRKFEIFRDVPPLRALRRELLLNGSKVGFVPTMGALHPGHLSLLRHALLENDAVFVSIYVNPTQFGVNEDLDKYPKTWEEDLRKIRDFEGRLKEETDGSSKVGRVMGIFAPTTKVMYPILPPSSEINGDGSFVTITPLGKWLEGASRPVFFRGVATVCTKLFNIVQPDRVYFGQKDVQQSVLIRRMVKDFWIPTEVRVIETERESDGLAMSSRNVYLGDRRRQDVAVLPSSLIAIKEKYTTGNETSVLELKKTAFDVFKSKLGFRDGKYWGESCVIEIDYIAVSRADDMAELGEDAVIDPSQGAIVSAAIKVNPVFKPETDDEKAQIAVRLIDNIILEPTR